MAAHVGNAQVPLVLSRAWNVASTLIPSVVPDIRPLNLPTSTPTPAILDLTPSTIPDYIVVPPSKPAESPADSQSSQDTKSQRIPQYIFDHAPCVYLHSEEEYWPGDIAEHLKHTTPHVNFTQADDIWLNPALDDLGDLNEFAPWAYLQSNDDPETHPNWITGRDNIPNPKGDRYDRLHRNKEESEPFKSKAPVALIVVDKGDGIVDAFWFYFYHFNRGNAIFRTPFGHHVGDWEHTAIRFENGVPKLVFFSEHEWGNAYTWEACEKMGDRLVTYSASGTHAMYGSAGLHKYMLPFGLLYDDCNKGPLWDPTLNIHAYNYNPASDVITPSSQTPDAPTSWFHFSGRWGDKKYPSDDKRQYRFVGQDHYVDGPQGPKFKNLGRKAICQVGDFEHCAIVDKMD